MEQATCQSPRYSLSQGLCRLAGYVTWSNALPASFSVVVWGQVCLRAAAPTRPATRPKKAGVHHRAWYRDQSQLKCTIDLARAFNADARLLQLQILLALAPTRCSPFRLCYTSPVMSPRPVSTIFVFLCLLFVADTTDTRGLRWAPPSLHINYDTSKNRDVWKNSRHSIHLSFETRVQTQSHTFLFSAAIKRCGAHDTRWTFPPSL
jgi:hypothetical protein